MNSARVRDLWGLEFLRSRRQEARKIGGTNVMLARRVHLMGLASFVAVMLCAANASAELAASQGYEFRNVVEARWTKSPKQGSICYQVRDSDGTDGDWKTDTTPYDTLRVYANPDSIVKVETNPDLGRPVDTEISGLLEGSPQEKKVGRPKREGDPAFVEFRCKSSKLGWEYAPFKITVTDPVTQAQVPVNMNEFCVSFRLTGAVPDPQLVFTAFTLTFSLNDEYRDGSGLTAWSGDRSLFVETPESVTTIRNAIRGESVKASFLGDAQFSFLWKLRWLAITPCTVLFGATGSVESDIAGIKTGEVFMARSGQESNDRLPMGTVFPTPWIGPRRLRPDWTWKETPTVTMQLLTGHTLSVVPTVKISASVAGVAEPEMTLVLGQKSSEVIVWISPEFPFD